MEKLSAASDPDRWGDLKVMMTFRGNDLGRLTLPVSSVWLVADVAEAKGRQDLYLDKPPEILTSLRETALIQSVESSNRIEGITVAPDRLRPLVLENDRPRDRSEEEIRGYGRALELVRSSDGWHEGRHDLIPWLSFFLSILKRAYRELDRLPA
jgi:hypothetical protein